MTAITQTCRDCQESFLVDGIDQAHYMKIGVPIPTLCPDHRQRRRMSFRNERNFYYRKCDLCAKQIISIYRPDSPHTVYCNACWWSDKWDPMAHGQEIDWNRPFFDQMKELQLKVPRLALLQKNSENCDFTNHCENNRNCYMCVDTADSEDVFFSKWILSCRDCADSYNIEKSELCYSAQYQVGAYKNIHCFLSDYCRDSSFLYNCKSCEDCFMSSNLQHKKFYAYNQQLTEEQYRDFMKTVDLKSHEQLEKYLGEYVEMLHSAPKEASHLILSENCSGDCIYQSKNVFDSFDIIESQDCRYCTEAGHQKDSYDVYESAFEGELQYECHGCNRGKFLKFGHVSYDISDSDYVDSCHNSSHLFACTALRHKKYAIFNKVYSQEEYESLRARLIEHMKNTGEWGEFFPPALSPFAYNETVAQEYFPLDDSKAESLDHHYQGPIAQIPDHLDDTSEEITKGILQCESTGKLYRITPQELAFHRKLGLALPRLCPEQRYLNRLALRSPRKLRPDHCVLCAKSVQTPHPAEWNQKIYCKACFVTTFY